MPSGAKKKCTASKKEAVKNAEKDQVAVNGVIGAANSGTKGQLHRVWGGVPTDFLCCTLCTSHLIFKSHFTLNFLILSDHADSFRPGSVPERSVNGDDEVLVEFTSIKTQIVGLEYQSGHVSIISSVTFMGWPWSLSLARR